MMLTLIAHAEQHLPMLPGTDVVDVERAVVQEVMEKTPHIESDPVRILLAIVVFLTICALVRLLLSVHARNSD